MKVSTRSVGRFLSVMIAGAGFLTGSLAGCGGSDKIEMSAETKKSVVASKVGDPSKFIKPGKGRVSKSR